MLKFDAQTTRFLEDAYHGSDFSRRRRMSFDALAPAPGERIVDLGCGNGLLTLELSRAVGPSGRVLGVDASEDMLRAARDRCAGRDNVALMPGHAGAMPLAEHSADKAVSLQVFEYLDDLRPALSDLHRVLRPAGRVVISDMHFDTLVWHSEHPDRMARMIHAWDAHLAERRVPQLLPAALRDSGFHTVSVIPHTTCDIDLRPDGLAQVMIHLMSGFALSTGAMSESEIADWAREQATLAQNGRFWFSLTHYVTVATRS
ncbi:methyltransferase domain-containing protein [Microbulbifer sp. S227A]|uniref:methyltransferase domain-containing protein n=1 Tax=Microbulbifer sp. S227A TaxID=3415131 RepID=UPI003C7CC28F